jgi:hypothetical protein
MKNKDEIRQEICQLAKKISEKPADDLLLETARELYEKSIVLKHANDAAIQAISKEEEKVNTKAEETAKSETPSMVAEKKQVAIDLFSSATVSPVISSSSSIEKSIAKEPKEYKKNTNESVAEKLQHKKISDLKSSIGINEKFQFINQLFEGNMKEYNVAVDQINNLNTYAEAESYISNLQGVYKWNGDEAVTVNFLELVQRRFM